MSTLQITKVSNEYKRATSICAHNTKEDDKLNDFSRKDKAVMKIFRYHARSMFLKHRTRYEKDPPKFVKDLISTLQNGIHKRGTVHNGEFPAQIKLKNLVNESLKAEDCAGSETELSAESKYILRFLRDISVEQAVIKQNFLVKLKEHLVERDAGRKQMCELQKEVTDETKTEDDNSENIYTNLNNHEYIENIATDEYVLPWDQSEIPLEQAIIRAKLIAELKERLAKIKIENVSDSKRS